MKKQKIKEYLSQYIIKDDGFPNIKDRIDYRRIITNNQKLKSEKFYAVSIRQLATICLSLCIVIMTILHFAFPVIDCPVSSLSITVYPKQDEHYKSETLEEDKEMVLGDYHVATSIFPGLPITFEGEAGLVEITSDSGQFLLWNCYEIEIDSQGYVSTIPQDEYDAFSGIENMGESFFIANPATVYWVPYDESTYEFTENCITINFNVIQDGKIKETGQIVIVNNDGVFTATLTSD